MLWGIVMEWVVLGISWGAFGGVPSSEEVVLRHGQDLPQMWGDHLSGVRTRMDTTDRVLALTLDACGGAYDGDLIAFLERERIPATLFLTGIWVDAHPREAAALAAQPLFEIANHGLHHRPASVSGRKAYGLQGTRSVRELVEEIEGNGTKLQTLTKHTPRYYRSGTNFYDDVALRVVKELGYEAVGCAVAGDAGATLSRGRVREVLLRSAPGDIILCHMNRPRSETAEGLAEALPMLRRRGFRFVLLSEYPLQD